MVMAAARLGVVMVPITVVVILVLGVIPVTEVIMLHLLPLQVVVMATNNRFQAELCQS
jgi:hypothetical protein